MSEEKLYNLSLKDYTLEIWKSKLGYPLNQKDIEELEHIIDYYEQENKHLKEKHYLIQGGRGNCKTYLLKLQEENKQLKEQLDKATRVALSEQKYASKCENWNIKYKSVLDEIREYIKSNISYEKNSDGYGEPYLGGYEIQNLLQILDKVKE